MTVVSFSPLRFDFVHFQDDFCCLDASFTIRKAPSENAVVKRKILHILFNQNV